MEARTRKSLLLKEQRLDEQRRKKDEQELKALRETPVIRPRDPSICRDIYESNRTVGDFLQSQKVAERARQTWLKKRKDDQDKKEAEGMYHPKISAYSKSLKRDGEVFERLHNLKRTDASQKEVEPDPSLFQPVISKSSKRLAQNYREQRALERIMGQISMLDGGEVYDEGESILDNLHLEEESVADNLYRDAIERRQKALERQILENSMADRLCNSVRMSSKSFEWVMNKIERELNMVFQALDVENTKTLTLNAVASAMQLVGMGPVETESNSVEEKDFFDEDYAIKDKTRGDGCRNVASGSFEDFAERSKENEEKENGDSGVEDQFAVEEGHADGNGDVEEVAAALLSSLSHQQLQVWWLWDLACGQKGEVEFEPWRDLMTSLIYHAENSHGPMGGQTAEPITFSRKSAEWIAVEFVRRFTAFLHENLDAGPQCSKHMNAGIHDEENFSFTPQLNPKSLKMAEKTQTVMEKMASGGDSLERVPRHEMLHDHAREKDRRLVEEKERQFEMEMEGCTFQPQVNKSTSWTSQREASPFQNSEDSFDDGISRTSAATQFHERLYKLASRSSDPNILTAEEQSLLKCTFKPRVNVCPKSTRASVKYSNSQEKSIERLRKAHQMKKDKMLEDDKRLGLYNDESYSRSRKLAAAGPQPFSFDRKKGPTGVSTRKAFVKDRKGGEQEKGGSSTSRNQSHPQRKGKCASPDDQGLQSYHSNNVPSSARSVHTYIAQGAQNYHQTLRNNQDSASSLSNERGKPDLKMEVKVSHSKSCVIDVYNGDNPASLAWTFSRSFGIPEEKTMQLQALIENAMRNSGIEIGRKTNINSDHYNKNRAITEMRFSTVS